MGCGEHDPIAADLAISAVSPPGVPLPALPAGAPSSHVAARAAYGAAARTATTSAELSAAVLTEKNARKSVPIAVRPW